MQSPQLFDMETSINTPQILRHDIGLIEATVAARKAGLKLCMNNDGRFALLDQPEPGWWQVGKLAKLVGKMWEAA